MPRLIYSTEIVRQRIASQTHRLYDHTMKMMPVPLCNAIVERTSKRFVSLEMHNAIEQDAKGTFSATTGTLFTPEHADRTVPVLSVCTPSVLCKSCTGYLMQKCSSPPIGSLAVPFDCRRTVPCVSVRPLFNTICAFAYPVVLLAHQAHERNLHKLTPGHFSLAGMGLQDMRHRRYITSPGRLHGETNRWSISRCFATLRCRR